MDPRRSPRETSPRWDAMTRGGEVEFWPVAGAGRPGPVIEIERDSDWEPPEPRPWSPRIRIAGAGVAAAVAAGVWFAGIARPTSLEPVFLRVGTAEALALDSDRVYVSG